MKEEKQKAPDEIIAGDLVKLNRVLTVTDTSGEGIECSWFDEKQKLHQDTVQKEHIEKITT